MSIELRIDQQVLDKSRLKQVVVEECVDPLYGKLQTQTMDVTARSYSYWDNFANLEEKIQLYRDDQLKNTLRVKELTHMKISDIAMRCRSDLEFLEVKFMGGMYTNADPVTVLAQIMGDHSYSLDQKVANKRVTGHLPICTRRQALEQLAFALEAALTVTPEGHVRLTQVPLDINSAVHMDPNRLPEGVQITTQPYYTKVELVSHRWVASTQWVEVYNKRDLGTQEVTVTFNQPNAEYALAEGRIVAKGPNFITFVPAGPETLKIRPYLHYTNTHTTTFPIDTSRFSNALTVREMTLVNEDNAQSLMTRLKQVALMRQQLQMRIPVENEVPGQTLYMRTPWGTRFLGCISRMKTIHTQNNHIADITVVGRENKE